MILGKLDDYRIGQSAKHLHNIRGILRVPESLTPTTKRHIRVKERARYCVPSGPDPVTARNSVPYSANDSGRVSSAEIDLDYTRRWVKELGLEQQWNLVKPE